MVVDVEEGGGFPEVRDVGPLGSDPALDVADVDPALNATSMMTVVSKWSATTALHSYCTTQKHLFHFLPCFTI